MHKPSSIVHSAMFSCQHPRQSPAVAHPLCLGRLDCFPCDPSVSAQELCLAKMPLQIVVPPKLPPFSSHLMNIVLRKFGRTGCIWKTTVYEQSKPTYDLVLQKMMEKRLCLFNPLGKELWIMFVPLSLFRTMCSDRNPACLMLGTNNGHFISFLADNDCFKKFQSQLQRRQNRTRQHPSSIRTTIFSKPVERPATSSQDVELPFKIYAKFGNRFCPITIEQRTSAGIHKAIGEALDLAGRETQLYTATRSGQNLRVETDKQVESLEVGVVIHVVVNNNEKHS